MDLHLSDKDRQEAWAQPRRQGDAPAAAGAGRPDTPHEALFDITDFEAIAAFAGIRRERPRRLGRSGG